jgi:hypothetical protein
VPHNAAAAKGSLNLGFAQGCDPDQRMRSCPCRHAGPHRHGWTLTWPNLTSDKAQHAHTSDRHPGARRDPLGERSGPRTERATLQRVDTGPVSSTGWHFRRDLISDMVQPRFHPHPGPLPQAGEGAKPVPHDFGRRARPTPSPPFSGERVGVRGQRAAQLNMVTNQLPNPAVAGQAFAKKRPFQRRFAMRKVLFLERRRYDNGWLNHVTNQVAQCGASQSG